MNEMHFTEKLGGTSETLSDDWHTKRIDNFQCTEKSYSKRVPQKRRVILVDDERIGLTLTKKVLEVLGYDVVTFDNGQSAYNELSTGLDFDILITDYNMPQMNGGELIDKARRLSGLAGIPTILLTGLYEAKEMSELANQPSVTIIEKPVKIEKLSKTLQDLLSPAPALV